MYVKNTFWARMSTTERSESMNVFFLWLCGPKDYIKAIC